MKKYPHLPEYFALTFVLVVFGGLAYTLIPAPAPQVEETARAIIRPSSPAKNGPSLSVVEENRDTPYSQNTLAYPQFKGGAETLNEPIEKLVRSTLADHDKAAEENWKARVETADPKGSVPALPPADQKLYYDADWELAHMGKERVSLIERISTFDGGAHGETTVTSFNYDVAHGKPLVLAELFPNDPNYLKTISDQCVKELRDRFTESEGKDGEKMMDQQILDGAGPKLENFAAFTVTANTLTIYFQDYQVGPHAIGMPTVDIPLPR